MSDMRPEPNKPQNLLIQAKEYSARKNLAENSSVGPVENVSDSEDFSQMNRGTDVITEK
jgi:hypothetical protein